MLMILGAILLGCQIWVIFESFYALKNYRRVKSARGYLFCYNTTILSGAL